MIAKGIFSHLLAAVFYASLVTFLGRHFRPEFIFFWLGIIIGVILFYFDPLVSAYFGSPNPVSQEIKQLISQKKFSPALAKVFALHQIQEQPILHSAFLQSALMLLAFYVLTSSGSLLGSGLVMGMIVHLIQDEVAMWRREPERLKRILFWNIHREISEAEMRIFLGAVLALFGLETMILI